MVVCKYTQLDEGKYDLSRICQYKVFTHLSSLGVLHFLFRRVYTLHTKENSLKIRIVGGWKFFYYPPV
jgi:hypothetical protein